MTRETNQTTRARSATRATRATGATRPTESLSPEVSVDRLWSDFLATGNIEARDRLVLHYTSLVSYVASRVGASMPNTVDYSDLAQSGVIGLMDAIDRFDPDRGVKFETYAATRIRGAIIDELRALDWVPRAMRRKARDIDTAAEGCQTRLGRTPTDADLADALEVTTTELANTRARMGRMRVVALDELMSMGLCGEKLSLAETLADPSARQPGDALEERDLHSALESALGAMAERDRTVLVHSYLDGLTLAQIGQRVGVTESRVCQIREKALREARGHLLARLAE